MCAVAPTWRWKGRSSAPWPNRQLYRSWNCSVIGMTNMPEAKLAREAELCYASVSMVTDFDCWHPAHDAVTVDAIIKVLLSNASAARTLVARLAGGVVADPQAARPAAAAMRWSMR
jgi:5'-methylthioadenosine phosphorylase